MAVPSSGGAVATDKHVVGSLREDESDNFLNRMYYYSISMLINISTINYSFQVNVVLVQ